LQLSLAGFLHLTAHKPFRPRCGARWNSAAAAPGSDAGLPAPVAAAAGAVEVPGYVLRWGKPHELDLLAILSTEAFTPRGPWFAPRAHRHPPRRPRKFPSQERLPPPTAACSQVRSADGSGSGGAVGSRCSLQPRSQRALGVGRGPGGAGGAKLRVPSAQGRCVCGGGGLRRACGRDAARAGTTWGT
jgi:hypothetical protein